MHIYANTKDGIETRHKAPYAKPRFDSDGNEIFRDATLRDFKKWLSEGEKVAPSVTTVLDIFDKPALMNWKIGEHLKSVWQLINSYFIHIILNDDFEKFADKVKIVTKERLDQAPKAGTDFHKSIEKAIVEYKTGVMPNELELKVIELIKEKTDSQVSDWKSEINIFSDEYAGQCDLFIPAGEENDAWVIDFKTKETKDKFKPGKMAFWQSHLSQLMAYSAELDFEARVANVFVCLETGEIDFHEWTDEELKTKAWEYFMMGVNAWWIANV